MKRMPVLDPCRREPRPNRTPATLATSFDLRHNAIAFLRVMLSVLVVLGHSWELGGFGRDPLARHADVPIGVFAVHAFFVLGGFLVAGSFEHAPSWRRYLVNRALRIFPGYWACLFVTVVLLVPLSHAIARPGTTGLDATEAFSAVRYGFANFLLRINQPTIGRLFADNPASGIVNGSLWSLFPEMLCYTFLAVAGVMGCMRTRGRWGLVAIALLAWFLQACGPKILATVAATPWEPKVWYLLQLDSLLTYFCGGALLWIFRTRVPFSKALCYLAVLAAFVALLGGWHRVVGPLVLPPAMLALAVLLPWQNFDRHGDFSYGLYLYHYPLQQTLYASDFRFASPLTFFLTTLIAVFPLAWLSWQWIERPALRLKPQSLHRAGA
jgi:peptidoglycan/LPS O-acetylase OafA/YrhL